MDDVDFHHLMVNLENRVPSLSLQGKTYIVIASYTILAKMSKVVPNIPTHDTWLSSRIIC